MKKTKKIKEAMEKYGWKQAISPQYDVFMSVIKEFEGKKVHAFDCFRISVNAAEAREESESLLKSAEEILRMINSSLIMKLYFYKSKKLLSNEISIFQKRIGYAKSIEEKADLLQRDLIKKSIDVHFDKLFN